ncbi:unnamed protein product [Adineta ricciae]|uniref:Cystatin domain-containing protein n=1 Tax=Adineta ricciae TaxID=249248 RepID=A0A814VGA6_ADIRI|nr:unnamed protein product [Adineta ricciae]CAF1187753.1 unnamed protein product [Adineta ricciae]
MHPKTLFIAVCFFTILCVELNYGAPTKKTTVKTTTKAPKTTIEAKPKLLGAHTPWDKNIKAKHKKIFDDYKKVISKKLQETHNVSKTFNPKPEKFATQAVGGINYLYLVKLPINKYAVVSVHDVIWKKDHYGKEENVRVRPQTYELNDKNI